MAFNTFNEGDGVLSEINITPLVDVMLVLLVAFIVTAPLMNNAVKINLPQTAVTAPPKDNKAVTVSVNAECEVFIDKRQISADNVEPELIALKSGNPDVVLQLQADDLVPYGAVAKIMASIERAGITKLAVLTQPL